MEKEDTKYDVQTCCDPLGKTGFLKIVRNMKSVNLLYTRSMYRNSTVSIH